MTVKTNMVLSRQTKESRPWFVVHDPEGDFTGRSFRGVDVDQSDGWPEGIIFWNTRTGALCVRRSGRLIRYFPRRQA